MYIVCIAFALIACNVRIHAVLSERDYSDYVNHFVSVTKLLLSFIELAVFVPL